MKYKFNPKPKKKPAPKPIVEDELPDILEQVKEIVQGELDTFRTELGELELPEPEKAENGVDGEDGEDGETPSEEYLLSLIEPLIPEPIKGDDGADGESYVLTEKDKKEIAGSITVPIVEKVVEKREIIREKPVVIDRTEEVQKLIETAKDGFKEELKKLKEKHTAEMATLRSKVMHGGGDTVEAGTGVTITEGSNGRKVINATGGAGAVDSVNGETGVVVLTTGDIAEDIDANYVTDAEKTALHAAVTVTDSSEINFTLVGQDLTASIVVGSIDETKLDASTNASLDLADSSIQPADLTNYFLKTADDTDDITEGATNKFATTAEKTKLSNLSGINTGDQTSIVGITGTKAQFDTAVTDGNIMYVGDAPTTHAHAISDVTGLQTALDNKLDDTQFVGLLKITVGTSAPGSPTTGDLWIDTN